MWDSLEGESNCDLRIRHCFAPGNPNQAFNLFENLLGGKKKKISFLASNVEEQSGKKDKSVHPGFLQPRTGYIIVTSFALN